MTDRHGQAPGATWWVPDRLDPGRVADGVHECKGCELYRDATHGVPGEGPQDARLLVVGEQPGDQEDQAGRPFVGPAGRLLDGALAEAGIDREQLWLTNAVKHFRWEARGSNRLHKSPAARHVSACGPWLLAEVDMVRPEGVLLLGGTAGKAVLGPSFKVGDARGRRLEWPSLVRGRATRWTPSWVVATAHPSAVLRSRQRDQDHAALVADLHVVAELLAQDAAQDLTDRA